MPGMKKDKADLRAECCVDEFDLYLFVFQASLVWLDRV